MSRQTQKQEIISLFEKQKEKMHLNLMKCSTELAFIKLGCTSEDLPLLFNSCGLISKPLQQVLSHYQLMLEEIRTMILIGDFPKDTVKDIINHLDILNGTILALSVSLTMVNATLKTVK
jgi:hypothetical protein